MCKCDFKSYSLLADSRCSEKATLFYIIKSTGSKLDRCKAHKLDEVICSQRIYDVFKFRNKAARDSEYLLDQLKRSL